MTTEDIENENRDSHTYAHRGRGSGWEKWTSTKYNAAVLLTLHEMHAAIAKSASHYKSRQHQSYHNHGCCRGVVRIPSSLVSSDGKTVGSCTGEEESEESSFPEAIFGQVKLIW